MLNRSATPEARRARQARGTLAVATREHGPDAVVTGQARDRWRTARWVAAVAEIVAEAPPLDVETREHVRALLAPIVRGGTDKKSK